NSYMVHFKNPRGAFSHRSATRLRIRILFVAIIAWKLASNIKSLAAALDLAVAHAIFCSERKSEREKFISLFLFYVFQFGSGAYPQGPPGGGGRRSRFPLPQWDPFSRTGVV